MVGGIRTLAGRLEATTTDPAVTHPVAALGDRPSEPASTCPGRPRPVGTRLVGLVVVGTTARWARTEPLSPDRTPRRSRRWRDHREVIDAIARKLRTGSQWAHQPEQYGSWKGVHTRLRNRAIDGTRQRVLTAPPAQTDTEGDLDRVVTVDTTTVRAHQNAAGALQKGLRPTTARSGPSPK
ncbi:transposase [Kitasatospora purpeofusca]|uniref:transposase n=1 Tax=Kitasatospora purpeofusca TaxID=67352 RepID=UPI003F4AB933